MLSDFIQYLTDRFSCSITELSETGGNDHNCNSMRGKKFIKDNFEMIDVDYIACKFPGLNLSSVDGLYVKEENGKTVFYLIEFKKMNFKDLDSLEISLNYLKYQRTLYDDNSDFLKAYDNCEDYLADKTQVSLEIKPLNTLMLLHKLYVQYKYCESSENLIFSIDKEFTNNYLEDKESLDEFSKIIYKYIIVYQFNEFTPNTSNNHEAYDKYFNFLKKLKPYPFSMALPVDSREFEEYVLRKIKGEI